MRVVGRRRDKELIRCVDAGRGSRRSVRALAGCGPSLAVLLSREVEGGLYFERGLYFAREEHCKTWTAPRRSPDTTTTTTTPPRLFGDQSFKIIYFRLRGKSSLPGCRIGRGSCSVPFSKLGQHGIPRSSKGCNRGSGWSWRGRRGDHAHWSSTEGMAAEHFFLSP